MKTATGCWSVPGHKHSGLGREQLHWQQGFEVRWVPSNRDLFPYNLQPQRMTLHDNRDQVGVALSVDCKDSAGTSRHFLQLSIMGDETNCIAGLGVLDYQQTGPQHHEFIASSRE